MARHVALIMDGNARWAASRGAPTRAGHAAGVDALRRAVRAAGAAGLDALTVFALSSDNLSRSADELADLHFLFEEALRYETPQLVEEGVRLHVVGALERLPASLEEGVRAAEAATRGGSGLQLTVCLGYGGRDDLVRAARDLARAAARGDIDPEDIDERMLSGRLATAVLPEGLAEPDLLIRTSGEQRLSNFLLWELAYTELYFTETLWPDFGEDDLYAALEAFAARSRRFGLRGGASGAA